MSHDPALSELIQAGLCRKDLDGPELHLRLQYAYNKLASDMAKCVDKAYAKDKEKNMKHVYEIMAIYGGNAEPVFMFAKKPFVYGADDEEAIVRSEIHKDLPPDWDPAFITILCRRLGSFKTRT